MARRGGSFLESSVLKLFKLAGFEAETNVRLSGYEVDVYVKYGTLDIIVECKQRDSGGLNIRNLIHQWESKNKEIGASKILLVVTGVNITHDARELANKYDIAIWDEDKLENLIDEAIDKKSLVRDKILIEMGLESTDYINKKIKNVMNIGYDREKAINIIKKRGYSKDLLDELRQEKEELEKAERDRIKKERQEKEELEKAERDIKRIKWGLIILAIAFIVIIGTLTQLYSNNIKSQEQTNNKIIDYNINKENTPLNTTQALDNNTNNYTKGVNETIGELVTNIDSSGTGSNENIEIIVIYDDFSSGNLNNSKWTEELRGTVTESFVSADEGTYHILQNSTNGYTVLLHMKRKMKIGESLEFDLNYKEGNDNLLYFKVNGGDINNLIGVADNGLYHLTFKFMESKVLVLVKNPDGSITEREVSNNKNESTFAVVTGQNTPKSKIHVDYDNFVISE